MKKSQVQTQIFIYVMALVIFSLILLYGYNSIKKIREQASSVEYIQFKTDIENTITKLGYEFGSVDIKEFNVPGNYKQVCFVEFSDSLTIPADYPIINNSVYTNASDNVFLVKNIAEESFKVKGLVVDGNFHCFNISKGRIEVRIESLGSAVRVSEP